MGEEQLDVGRVRGRHQRFDGQVARPRDAGPGLLELRQRRDLVGRDVLGEQVDHRPPRVRPGAVARVDLWAI